MLVKEIICQLHICVARILLEPGFVAVDDNAEPHEKQNIPILASVHQPPEVIPQTDKAFAEVHSNQEPVALGKEDDNRELVELRARGLDEIDKESNIHDEGTSCFATCTTSDIDEDIFKTSYSYEVEEGGNDVYGPLTSCVGTRWFRAPELLYGSANYGAEIDLWSLSCIFAELFSLEPLFPGTSDIDQLSRIFSVLGNLTHEVWPGCHEVPDCSTISFLKVENPLGLEACLPNCSVDEILLVKRLLCFDPSSRATAMELLHDKYLNEEPLPVAIAELRFPSSHTAQNESSRGEWADYKSMGSDSDFEDFGALHVTTSNSGFSIKFH